ncbi:hypothetical protein ABPG72_020124 [Tetrahymena utriculariae]
MINFQRQIKPLKTFRTQLIQSQSITLRLNLGKSKNYLKREISCERKKQNNGIPEGMPLDIKTYSHGNGGENSPNGGNIKQLATPIKKGAIKKQKQRRYQTLPCQKSKEGINNPLDRYVVEKPLAITQTPIKPSIQKHIKKDDGTQIGDPKDGPTGQNVVGQYDHHLP